MICMYHILSMRNGFHMLVTFLMKILLSPLMSPQASAGFCVGASLKGSICKNMGETAVLRGFDAGAGFRSSHRKYVCWDPPSIGEVDKTKGGIQCQLKFMDGFDVALECGGTLSCISYAFLLKKKGNASRNCVMEVVMGKQRGRCENVSRVMLAMLNCAMYCSMHR